MEIIRCDVLIVGSGGAGLRAAIEAKETFPEGTIVLAAKGVAGQSGVTAVACSDRMAFHATLPHTEPGGPDNWRLHAEDVYEIGGFVSDGDLAFIQAREACGAFDYLDRLGVPFAKKNGMADQFITDGSDYARACYTGPRTAGHIEEALLKKLASLDVIRLDHTMVVDLITSRRRVVGAFILDEKATDVETGLRAVECKTVVLATGGAGETFSVHVYPTGMTGDGFAAAYRAGAELVNMEFIQIGLSSVKTKLACSGSMMRALPRFVNEEGREFLGDHLPPGTTPAEVTNLTFEKGASWPVSVEKRTCLIDIAVAKEIGRGHRVFLDYGTNPMGFRFTDLLPVSRDRYRREIRVDIGGKARQARPLHRLREINPDSVAWLKEYGIDVEAGDRVEIAPAIQHFQGGVKIRGRADTSIPGLYAAGEAAGGQHGANRPGGNALMDSQVFGRIAGREAAIEARAMERLPAVSTGRIRAYLKDLRRLRQGQPAGAVRQKIQALASRCGGVVRTEQALKAGMKEIQTLRKEGVALDGNGPAFTLETENLLDVAEMVLRACLARKESRGPHLFFGDPKDLLPRPVQDPRWRKYLVISNEKGRMILKKRTPVKLPVP
jgi:succinate dehydrogenase/fumarate reductase flavoprotein subunit